MAKKKITQTQINRRIAICKSCPEVIKHQIPLKKDKNKIYQCGICKCFIMLKAKLKSQRCPEGNWPEVI